MRSIIDPYEGQERSESGIFLPESSAIEIARTAVPQELQPPPVPQEFAGMDITIIGDPPRH